MMMMMMMACRRIQAVSPEHHYKYGKYFWPPKTATSPQEVGSLRKQKHGSGTRATKLDRGVAPPFFV